MVELTPIADGDFDAVRDLAVATARAADVGDEDARRALLDYIEDSLRRWWEVREQSFHCKSSDSGRVVGFVIVQQWWNLSHMFVSPSHQRRGIGRRLVEAALIGCRDRSPHGKLRCNSSTAATAFYRSLGFVQTGPGRDLPGGCIPFEYVF